MVCNPLYTSYHTTPARDRLTVADVLRPGPKGTYLLDELALGWLEAAGASAGVRARVAAHPPRNTVLGVGQRSRIFDGAAITAYHAQTALPVAEVLVCDAADQFVGVTLARALRVPSGWGA